MIRIALIGGAVAWMWLPSLAIAQHGGNPYEGDAAAVRAGNALYAGRCADCHGADAKGNRGPDLTLLWAAGGNDERLFASIRRGVEGSIMPPSFAPDSELWAIVAYLRSISTVPPLVSDGDPAHGRALFASQCSSCHRAGDGGGALGPELTRITRVRSREALVRAVREPSATVAEGFRAVTLVTMDGERASGVVKREDAYSVQIVAADQRLQGYRVADIRELVRERESLMPAFPPDQLSERELEDLLSFLGSVSSTGLETP
jgi:putative heme-binding domain-containing protein